MKRYCFEVRENDLLIFKAIVINRFKYKILCNRSYCFGNFKYYFELLMKGKFIDIFDDYFDDLEFRDFVINSTDAIANLRRFQNRFKEPNCKLYQIN